MHWLLAACWSAAPTGILRYTQNGAEAVLVLPVNLKFDRKEDSPLSELADSAALSATPIGSTAAVPPIDKGVTLVFVAAPNVELAEYLLARRIASIPGWQSYLAKNPGGAHSAEVKSTLAAMFVAAGEEAFSAYDQTATTGAPAYNNLKTAKAQAGKAHALVSDLKPMAELDGKVQGALAAISKQGRDELNAYRAALAAQTAGYDHLQNAKKYSDILGGIDPQFPDFAPLQKDVIQDTNTFQFALRMAQSNKDAKQFDEALKFITPYRAFGKEEPQVADIVNADYDFHFGAGKEAEVASNWVIAIREYGAAANARDTAEAQDALKNARAQLDIVKDKAAVAKAQGASRDFEAAHQVIKAYEVLANLPPAQRAQVTDDMQKLQPEYVQAASQMAKDLQRAHDPIRGIADEAAIESAYKYLERAYELSKNESFHDRMDLLGNELSAYFLDQAKQKLAKPAGSGTLLGWMYLTEALPYKASNLDAVRDAMIGASAAHATRSKVSIRVQFRDQTSQRESAGFAGQLENAVITGLEGAKIPVKVIRAGEVSPVEPDFHLAGDVLQHHLTTDPVVEAVESKYRAGTKEVLNKDWMKANRDNDAAQADERAAQTALEAAIVRKDSKKAITERNDAVKKAQKAAADARVALDSVPQTQTEDVIRPYSYTKRTINVTGVIQLQFRVEDAFNVQMTEPVSTTKEDHRQYILLENVKQEDTEGVKETGTMPDTAEFMTALESSTLQALIEGSQAVDELPRKIYAAANTRENEADLDGAGEAYLRYLYIVPNDGSSERKHAEQFLKTQFNNDAPVLDNSQ